MILFFLQFWVGTLLSEASPALEHNDSCSWVSVTYTRGYLTSTNPFLSYILANSQETEMYGGMQQPPHTKTRSPQSWYLCTAPAGWKTRTYHKPNQLTFAAGTLPHAPWLRAAWNRLTLTDRSARGFIMSQRRAGSILLWCLRLNPSIQYRCKAYLDKEADERVAPSPALSHVSHPALVEKWRVGI